MTKVLEKLRDWKSTKDENPALMCKGIYEIKCHSYTMVWLHAILRYDLMNICMLWKLVNSNNLYGCCLRTYRYLNCKQKISCGIEACTFFLHVLHNYQKSENPEENYQVNDQRKKTCNSMNGSNSTTLNKSLADKIGLDGSKESLCVKWYFGDTEV